MSTSSRFSRGAALAALLPGLFLPSVPKRARANPPPIVLHWSAPPGCPGQDSVLGRVVALAGPGVELEADATMTEAEGRLRLVLRVKSRGFVGERVLEGSSCEELTESAAVILAMSGTAGAAVASAASRLPPGETAPPTAATAAPPVESAPPRARPFVLSRAPILRVSLAAALDVGTLPTPAFGGALSVGVAPGRGVALNLRGTLWASSRGVLAADPQQGGTFDLLSVDATGCYALVHGLLELSPCVMLELERMSATGFGTPNSSSANPLWLAVGAGLEARWEWTRAFALDIVVAGIVPTRGESFAIRSATGVLDNVQRIGLAAARASLGPEVRF